MYSNLLDTPKESGAFRIEKSVKHIEPGLEHIYLRFHAEKAATPELISFTWMHPLVSTHHIWTTAAFDKRRMESWPNSSYMTNRVCSEAPVYAVYNQDGMNSLCFSHSDALNETELHFRVIEETSVASCEIHFFCEKLPAIKKYEVTIRIDYRNIPFYQALYETSLWWENMPQYKPMEVPEDAKLPMYSTWYNFHQDMTAEQLEKECVLAKELGMDSIIVDDGWQTEDNNRGYSYCGDWKIAENKFPNMREHVKRIHDIGMKYIMWFSVPYVGIRSSIYETFKGKFLDGDDPNRYWYILDPRFPEVREYLIQIYENFLKDYDIDGFKLDFVDRFTTTEYAASQQANGRDISSVPQAVDKLLTDIKKRLIKLKPNILIEFRQSYIGPAMRKYGNMFRAHDVPNDFTGNRIETIDVRLLCGNTACHADMTMWNINEPVESAAMQLVHTLFSVPQVSLLLEKLPENHMKMMRSYLKFWKKHRDVLLEGKLKPEHPEHLYTTVHAENSHKYIVAAYGTSLIKLPKKLPSELIIVNGTAYGEIVLSLTHDFTASEVSIYNCLGETSSHSENTTISKLHQLKIPKAGYAIIKNES